MFKSLIMAFSTYSKIPMPRIEWNKRNMAYSMCFFPLIGVVIGGVNAGALYLMKYIWGLSSLLTGAILSVVPVLITGGIHFDGFLDVADARSSYKDKEEKLRILKDPHIGAFAVIYGSCYMLLLVSFNYQLVENMSENFRQSMETYIFVAMGFVLSRILSGLSVLFFKKAKADGMATDSAGSAAGGCKVVLIIELILIVTGLLLMDLMRGVMALVAGIVSFVYYVLTAYRKFGGITGDLAGWFLCVCELVILIFVVVSQMI